MPGMIRLLNPTMLPQSRQHLPLVTTDALRLSTRLSISLLILINGPRTLLHLLKHLLRRRLPEMPLIFFLYTLSKVLFVQSADGGSLLHAVSSVV